MKNKKIRWCYVLNLISGTLVLLTSLLILLIAIVFSFWAEFPVYMWFIVGIIAVIPAVLGYLIIKEALVVRRSKRVTSKIVILNIISLILGSGFIIGPILGIVGYILANNRKT